VGTPEEKRAEPPFGWELSPVMRARLNAYWACDVNRKGVQAIARRLQR